MQSRWLQILERVSRPERPALSRCLEQRAQHLAERGVLDEARKSAIAACERRIHDGRAAVFAANDGVVPPSMTVLEREWRRLSRRDPDDWLMDLWAKLAPPSWLDRKRWRDAKPAARSDLAVALAADVAGVEAAEAAAGALRGALSAWGIPVGARVGFRLFEYDVDATSEHLGGPLRAARDALASGGDERGVISRMAALQCAILEAASALLPDREALTTSIAYAAFVDGMVAETRPLERPNPVRPLCELWLTGYVPATIDESGITLALPPL